MGKYATIKSFSFKWLYCIAAIVLTCSTLEFIGLISLLYCDHKTSSLYSLLFYWHSYPKLFHINCLRSTKEQYKLSEGWWGGVSFLMDIFFVNVWNFLIKCFISLAFYWMFNHYLSINMSDIRPFYSYWKFVEFLLEKIVLKGNSKIKMQQQRRRRSLTFSAFCFSLLNTFVDTFKFY